MTSEPLLDWYEPRRSLYPWRARPTPYRVLVSELMLQQTQASRVAPSFRRFVRRFPSVGALAAAPRSEVVRAWAGLGYNRRAVALSEGARAIVREHRGRIPDDIEALRRLSGVGPYTASAVAAIAFGIPVVALDTNVRRVVARSALGLEPGEADPRLVQRAAEERLGKNDPADWNQAVMDLGREICRPLPRCAECPISSACSFRRRGAVPRRRRRRTAPFEGSSRQLRGRIVAVLRDRRSVSLEGLAEHLGSGVATVIGAVRGLSRDGLVAGDARASRGDPGGRVRLST